MIGNNVVFFTRNFQSHSADLSRISTWLSNAALASTLQRQLGGPASMPHRPTCCSTQAEVWLVRETCNRVANCSWRTAAGLLPALEQRLNLLLCIFMFCIVLWSTTLHQGQFHRFLFFWYVLLCYVLLDHVPPFIISSLRILFARNTEVLLPDFLW